jgi:DNA processing protein
MEAEPFLGAFLRRNRWIAALSSALVLVEAPVSSGALKTAGHARELGRPVLVAPGPMYAESWAGSNRLLRDGAQIVTQSADVLARLGLGAPRLDSAGRRQGELWPEAQSRVFECLEALPLSLEEIVQRSGLTPAEVGGALVALELAGALRRHPGLLYGRP